MEVLTNYKSYYENILPMVAFNMTPSNANLMKYITECELPNLVSRPASFKSANPQCMDNFLTTGKSNFMKILKTSVSDQLKLISTMINNK